MKAIITAAALSCMTSAANADVTLINVFEVPSEKLETVVSAWEDAREFLSKEPGYIETTLHQSLRPNARFELINVARWESAEAFGAAAARMRGAGIFPRIDGLVVNPGLYTVIRTDAGQ